MTTRFPHPGAQQPIRLRGVRVHNLKGIDLDVPRRALTVICGVSGSGKSSLALDTLYAEGQRRYIESFPAHTRQLLQKLDRPEADRIDAIPPAVALTALRNLINRRATVASSADLSPLLQLLFARLGRVACPKCGAEIRQDSPQTVARFLISQPPERKMMLGFHQAPAADDDPRIVWQSLQKEGFVRAIVAGHTVSVNQPTPRPEVARGEGWDVIVDRLISGRLVADRLRESLETAFAYGLGECRVWMEASPEDEIGAARTVTIDGTIWREFRFGIDWSCRQCQTNVPAPEPQLLNPLSPLGACPRCEGLGSIRDWDLDWIVPDPSRSILGGAVRPWSESSFPFRLGEFLTLAPQLGVRTDVPWRELTPQEQKIVQYGDSASSFQGIFGQLTELAARTKGAAIKKLDKWKGDLVCPDCQGTRLRNEARTITLGGMSLPDVEQLSIVEARDWFEQLTVPHWQRAVAATIVPQICQRLEILHAVGLGYLAMNRAMDSLSRGEAQRVAFAAALGSSLVNLLYVFDEPTVGLHAHDIRTLIETMQQLRDRGNTVVVVDHAESLIRAADLVVEIGPQAGNDGGEVVFTGSVQEMLASDRSLTGAYLTGKRQITHGEPERRRPHGWIQLRGAAGHNLKHINVDFPLGVLCAVTGVSGAGKSSLVHGTLFAELCRRKQKSGPKPLPFASLEGSENIEDVVWVDHRSPAPSARSNPVTYVKAFGEIRRVFAETPEARIHNYTPGHFSFNVEGGRCEECRGEGWLNVDMQFLADVRMTCPVCQGQRFRDTILDVTYRGLNISQVLAMTAREAFRFFRGEKKVQSNLQRLLDVGLDYVRLGQPLDTLSAGEAQRLKLAGQLASTRRRRTLYLLEEPSSGLHTADLLKLLDCFDSLLAVGHSVIVIEHNPALIEAADYVLDLGPGPADQGGKLIARGTPAEIAACPESLTGRYLAQLQSRRKGQES